MKKIILTLFLAIMVTTGLYAQQISVVSTDGSTSLYRTFPEAIGGADPGSVIYLPGGGFPISDDVKITKKLTIIGIGYYNKSGNVDGVTTISGNLFFNAGSSGSAVLGCYITGDVNIGSDDAVNEVLIRYCNLKSVQVKKSTCMETTVNQCYIRESSSFNKANGHFNNNIAYTISFLNNGYIENNIFYNSNTGASTIIFGWDNSSPCVGSIISGNVFINSFAKYINNCQYTNNKDMSKSVFENANGISPTSNFHFTESNQQYENEVGIYAGDGFNDELIAPVPHIVAKRVDEQTDASGRLNVKIRVKAGD